MQQPAPSAPLPSFAGILAAIAAPGQKRPPARDLDGLEDDVATLSYERALRAHSRYKAQEPVERAFVLPPPAAPALPAAAPPVETADPGTLRIFEADPVEGNSAAAHPVLVSEPVVTSNWTEPAGIRPPAQNEPAPKEVREEFKEDFRQEFRVSDRNLRTVSITIRLNKAECATVHQRAAEAGLTVSAYLRSCTLEAESLRLMVKDTLARLRSEATKEATADNRQGGGRTVRAWFGWLRRWSPNSQSRVRVAGA